MNDAERRKEIIQTLIYRAIFELKEDIKRYEIVLSTNPPDDECEYWWSRIDEKKEQLRLLSLPD